MTRGNVMEKKNSEARHLDTLWSITILIVLIKITLETLK